MFRRNLDVITFRKNNVLRFNIPIYNSCWVKTIQRKLKLCHDSLNDSVIPLQPLRQVLSLSKYHCFYLTMYVILLKLVLIIWISYDLKLKHLSAIKSKPTISKNQLRGEKMIIFLFRMRNTMILNPGYNITSTLGKPYTN